MKIVATTSLPAVDRPNADRWDAARSRQLLSYYQTNTGNRWSQAWEQPGPREGENQAEGGILWTGEHKEPKSQIGGGSRISFEHPVGRGTITSGLHKLVKFSIVIPILLQLFSNYLSNLFHSTWQNLWLVLDKLFRGTFPKILCTNIAFNFQ